MPRAEKDRPLLALAIMTLLAESPRHPYEMRATMRARGHHRVIPSRGGSLYDTVARLQDEGLIQTAGSSRSGNRPERTVYQLTDRGRDELRDWLFELIATPAQEFPRFAAAISFLGVLQKKDAIRQLRAREAALERAGAAEATEHRAVLGQGIPPLFLIEADYFASQQKAEVSFVRRLVRDIEDGSLEWPNAAMIKRLMAAGFLDKPPGPPLKKRPKATNGTARGEE